MTWVRLAKHGNGYAVHIPRKLLALLEWPPGVLLGLERAGGDNYELPTASEVMVVWAVKAERKGAGKHE